MTCPPSDGATLVVGPSWVGDMVLAQSLFKLLKAGAPGRRLDVLAPAWSLPLLALMPEVDGAIAAPFAHRQLGLLRRRRLARALRGRGYDWAIVLPRSFKAALVPYWAGIARRTGFLGEGRWGLINDRRRPLGSRTVERFAALAMPRGAAVPTPPEPRLRIEKAQIDAALDAVGLTRPAGPLLALCPGAEFGPAKRWPADRFAELARDRLAGGWSVWLIGSAADRPLTARIAALAGPGCVDLAGRTDLVQAAALLALAAVVVTNDSGLMHVAAALDRRVVALFGSSSPAVTPPMSGRATVLWRGLPCSPCFRRTCPLGHLDCLNGIPAAMVADAVGPAEPAAP